MDFPQITPILETAPSALRPNRGDTAGTINRRHTPVGLQQALELPAENPWDGSCNHTLIWGVNVIGGILTRSGHWTLAVRVDGREEASAGLVATLC
jgi:hypothetical protein